MIQVCNGHSVEELLMKAVRRPTQFRSVVVVSPFLDEEGLRLLTKLDFAADRASFRLRICTRPAMAAVVREVLRNAATRVVDGKHLHAKAYALFGRRPADDELIVSSANLTRAGLGTNLELGLRLLGTTPAGRRLINRAIAWADGRRLPSGPLNFSQ